MDHADPDSPLIDIAVSRIPSENPDSRRGALLLIAGGRAAPVSTTRREGTEAPAGGTGHPRPDRVRPARPRPVHLRRLRAGARRPRHLKLRPGPPPDGSVDGNMDTARRMADACARNGGELIRHLSTANEARDIDRIRVALGERKISAWGVSYGTYVGAVYSQLFPHRTDRIVLDSVDNPDPARVSPRLARRARAGRGGHLPALRGLGVEAGEPGPRGAQGLQTCGRCSCGSPPGSTASRSRGPAPTRRS